MLSCGPGAYRPLVSARQSDADRNERLAAVSEAFAGYRAAQHAELDLLNERDRAILSAIRAGARLGEAAEAAAISRAAVSKIARRCLPSRAGRGGPYSRRRGSAAALAAVADAARNLGAARERTREARAQRDKEITNAVANGAGVSATAGAIGMTPASVSVIARSGRTSEAITASTGAVASHMR